MQRTSDLSGRYIGFFLGLGIFLLFLLLPAPEGMNPKGWKVLAVTALMATWWITDAIPIPATALLPILLFPALGILAPRATAAPYADDVIFLFMGGFFLAVTMERWNLHQRIALSIIRRTGSSPSMLVLGFMFATACLSMWVSNTATAMMMIPIGLAVVSEVTGLSPSQLRLGGAAAGSDMNIGRALMLGIAYSASVGGVTTIISTPPNAILVGTVKNLFGYTITFLDWMLIGIPLAIVTLSITWVILTQLLFPATSFSRGNVQELLDEKVAKLGPWTYEEKAVAFIGICMASMWILRGFLFKHVPVLSMVNDSTISIAGALMLFCWPRNLKKGEFLLDWKTAVNIPWSVLLLFGGGLALANGFMQTELTHYVAQHLKNLQGIHVFLVLTVVVLLVGTLTEITSNTATATLMVPVMGAVSLAMGINPLGPMMAAALVCSYCFMLPVATPPNAVAYATGCFSIKDMAKAGIMVNMVSFLLIPVVVYFLIPFFWGQDLSVTPEWALGGAAPK